MTNSAITLERSGMQLPYHVRKHIAIKRDRTIELSCRLENTGQHAFTYMWSAHPLISVPGDFELILPQGDLSLRTFPFDNESHAWPHYRQTDLSRSWVRHGRTLKLFVIGLREGWCALRQPEWTLRFAFELGTTPVLGIWFNNFGFPRTSAPRFRCLAIEPCTSASDLLDELPADQYPVIAPSEADRAKRGGRMVVYGGDLAVQYLGRKHRHEMLER